MLKFIAIVLFLLPSLSSAQVLTWTRPTHCALTNDKGECVREEPDPTITSYRIYFRLISQDPETCQSENCKVEIPLSKSEEFTHNVELPGKIERYDLQEDQAFIRGALYDIRIAALANNIESLKNDASVRTQIKGIPETPEEEVVVDGNIRMPHNNPIGDNKKSLGENKNEEINMGGSYSRGFIGSIIPIASAGSVRDTDVEQRRQSGGQQHDTGQQIPTLLGRDNNGPQRSTYQYDRTRSPTPDATVYRPNDRHEVVQPTIVKSTLVEGPKHLLRNDHGNVTRDISPRVSTFEPSVQSNDAIIADRPVQRKNSVIFYFTILLVALIIGYIWAERRRGNHEINHHGLNRTVNR